MTTGPIREQYIELLKLRIAVCDAKLAILARAPKRQQDNQQDKPDAS